MFEIKGRFAAGAVLAREERGQALVEYALVLMFVALVAVTALQSIGVSILGPLSDVATAVGGA